MMDKNTYKVFQYIIDHPKDDLHLNITSNMCPPDEKLKRSTFHFEVVIFHLCVVKLQFIILVLYVEPMKYFLKKFSGRGVC